MRRKAEVFLLDIRTAADYILRRTSEVDLAKYLEDEDLRFAVERNFMIIGEAASNLRRHYSVVGDQIYDLPAIVALRNFIVHQYWSINDEALWEIITHSLKPLRQTVATLLEDFPPLS
jgi:uncharacterized protein with HEPN domain